MFQLGVLLPTSRMFPRADHGFLEGLRAALTDAQIEFDLAVEPVGNCAVKDAVVEKVQRLLLLHRPRAVVGVMGSGMTPHVHDFFGQSRTPFLVNNLGAEPLLLTGEPNPYVFHVSLNLWQSAHALGAWSAEHVGRRACIAAAFHEGGYAMVEAFFQGFRQAGGEVVGIEVTHRESAVADPAQHLRRLAEQNPDFMMGFYSGREGISFMRTYAELELAKRFPLLTTPMMMHGYWLAKLGPAAPGVRTAFSWNDDAEPAAHARFRALCGVEPADEPAVFTLLGYESGRAIARALDLDPGAAAGGPALRDALAAAQFESPRGTLRFDAETGAVGTQDYLQELRCSSDGLLRRVTIEPLAQSPSMRADWQRYRQQETRSGWINPYLVN